jgi:outer membrane protein assembly factor BamB
MEAFFAALPRFVGLGGLLLAAALAGGGCKGNGLGQGVRRDSGTAVATDSSAPLLDSGPKSTDSPVSVKDSAEVGKDTAPVKADTALALKPGFSRCIEDWPTSGGPHPMKPSLSVAAPKLLWNYQTSGYQSGNLSDGGPVLSKDRLAFHSGDRVWFINKDGTGPISVKYNAIATYPSALVADLDGNIYFAAVDGVFSVDSLGKQRWSAAYGDSKLGEFSIWVPPVLGPDGVLYATTYDEQVRALRTSDGKVLWSQPAPKDKFGPSRVKGGAGKALFVSFGGTHTDALDTRDGSNLGSFVDPDNGRSLTWDWGAWLEGWDLGISQGNIRVFDACGKKRWAGKPMGAGVVAPGELIAISTDTQVGTLLFFNMAGEVVAGPAPAEGWPIAAGADGTIYTFRSQNVGTAALNRIVAYSYDLKELWHLDLGGQTSLGITGNIVLDDDGVLYLTRQAPGPSTEVIAIQTRSPGLADSSWPSLRHDNRGTAWLVPGTLAATTDAAAAPEAKDAPVDYLPSD